MGALCYLPMLHVVACCGKRCWMVCGFLGYNDAQSDVIVSDKIWASYKIRRPKFVCMTYFPQVRCS